MRKYVYVFYFVLFLISCSQEDFFYKVETIDNIKTINNIKPLWGGESKIYLEFVQKIGGLENNDENYIFFKFSEIARDANGNIYVLDTGNHRIQKFNSKGEFISTIGRKGQGPGEFLLPNGLELDSEGNLYILNIVTTSNCYIQVFSHYGKETNRIKLPFSSGLFWMNNSNQFIILAYGKGGGNKSKKSSLMYLLNKNGDVLKSFGTPLSFSQNGENYSPNDFYLAIDSKDNIYISFKNQNKIEKFDSNGIILWHANRPINYEIVYKTKKIPYYLMNREMTMEVPDYTTVSGGIGFDYKDRIWIKTYKKQKEEGDSLDDYIEFEVYNKDGILLGKLPVPQQGTLSIIMDRVYLLDSKEEMCIYEYKIIDK